MKRKRIQQWTADVDPEAGEEELRGSTFQQDGGGADSHLVS